MISVIIGTHNRPILLDRAIRSVLNQTFQDFELIVVDDGLEERADKVVASFNDPRIKYIQHQTEKDCAGSKNTGVRHSKGEFIAFLDDDDEWLPEKLEIQMKRFKDTPKDVAFSFTAVTNVFDNKEINTVVKDGVHDFHEFVLHRFNKILAITLLIKRFVFDDIGFMDETLPSHTDSDLLIRITKKYKGLGVNIPLARVTMGSGHDQMGKSFRRKIIGREIILSKHKEEFLQRPKVLAGHLFQLGTYYRNNGQFLEARSTFMRALKASFSLRVLFHYISMFFRGRLYLLLK